MAAVAGADAVYTDVWASMGQEGQAVRRREDFAGFTVDDAMMAAAAPHAVFLHCLPAHRGEEVAASVIDGPQQRRLAPGQQPGPRPAGPPPLAPGRPPVTRADCARTGDGRAASGRRPIGRHQFAGSRRVPVVHAPPGAGAGRSSGGQLRLAKPQRQHRLARIIEAQAVTSQAQLVDLLAAEGVVATQATVSRDLDDLGAVKVRMAGGEPVYAIPEHAKERLAPEEHLRRVLGEWVVEVAHSGNMVVLRTPPGSAHVVGLRHRPGRPGRRPRHASPATTPSWWWPRSGPAARPWPGA